MQNQSTPSDSCVISIAEDGDVAYFIAAPAFDFALETMISNEEDFLVIRQGGRVIVKAPDLSARFWDATLLAPNVVVVNAVGNAPNEVISVCERATIIRDAH